MIREGLRQLCSREFWQAFRAYYSPEKISERLDDTAARIREQTGQEPDWDVERRRAKRGAKHGD